MGGSGPRPLQGDAGNRWSRPAPSQRGGAAHIPRPPLAQVRLKPGLSKVWRLLRLQFCLVWGLRLLRQRRLTNFIEQLQGVAGLNFFRMCALSVGAVIRESGLTPLSPCSGFVNGVRAPTPFFQVYEGDRIHVVKEPRPRGSPWRSKLEGGAAPLEIGEVDGLTRTVTVWGELPLATKGSVAVFPFLTFRMYNWKYRY